jgi:hypothetical protein
VFLSDLPHNLAVLQTHQGVGQLPYVFQPPIVPAGAYSNPMIPFPSYAQTWASMTGVRFFDEREWGLVADVLEVADAWRNLETEVLRWRFEVTKPRKTAGGRELTALAQQIIGAIQNPTDLYRGSMQGEFAGWSASHVKAREYRRQGPGPLRTMIVPSKITRIPMAHLPLLRFESASRTPSRANSDLVWSSGPTNPQRWTPDEWSWEWVVTVCGENAIHPYGDPFLARICWPIARAISQFRGRITASPTFGNQPIVVEVEALADTREGQGKISRQAVADIQQLIQVYEQHGVLVSMEGTKIGLAGGAGTGAAGVVEMSRFFADLLRTAISGQQLTAMSSGTGPSGSSKVQANTQRDYAGMLADTVESSVSRMILGFLRLNGYEVDELDAPRLMWGGRTYVEPSILQFLMDGGAKLKQTQTARALGGDAAVALLELEDDEDGILEAKKVPPPIAPGQVRPTAREPEVDAGADTEDADEDEPPGQSRSMTRAAGPSQDEEAMAAALGRELSKLTKAPQALLDRALANGAAELTGSNWFARWVEAARATMGRWLKRFWRQGTSEGAAEVDYEADLRELAQRKAAEHLEKIWPEIDRATREGIAKSLDRAQGAKTAAAARPTMGATPKQVERIAEWERRQRAAGRSEEEIARGVERQAEAARKARAAEDARVGTGEAIEGGKLAAWQDALEAGRLPPGTMKRALVADSDARPLHIEQAAAPPIPLDAKFSIFGSLAPPWPAQPGCRCKLGVVIPTGENSREGA